MGYMDGTDRQALEMIHSGTVTMEQLWVAFFASGGLAGRLELEAHLYGLMPLFPVDEEFLNDALEELRNE